MNNSESAFMKIAEALLVDYSSVYYVNAITNEYHYFSINPEFNSLQLSHSGKDFFESTIHDTAAVVYEEDRELVLSALDKNRLMERMKNESVQSINYRLMINGQPVYHTLKLIRGYGQGNDYFVLGVINIDKQFRKEQEQEQLARERKIFNQIAESLAAHYDTIYYVDSETNEYIEFSSSDIYKSLNVPQSGSDFFEESRRNIARVIHEDDKERIGRIMTKDYILSGLKESSAFTTDYKLMIGGTVKYTRLSVMWASDQKHIIIGVENIDEHVRKELARKELEEKNITYNQIATSLANRYDSIYYVDAETNEYTEYSATSQYKSLNIETSGTDFFGDSARNIQTVIYEEDKELVLNAFQKENLLENLKDGKTFSLIYRLIMNQVPVYVNLRAVWAEDQKHLIVGVANIDEQIRKENEHILALRTANEKARKDDLTGVRNKNAFQEYERDLQIQIDAETNPLFAVVVCDVNGLKAVNDTLGHKAGDAYIRSACELICTIFSHSPVFRIGGDEFVTILIGRDYQHRDALLDKIRTQVLENQAAGNVIVATGMSVYDPDTDKKFTEVFERADTIMYENKKSLKGARL